jgi:hypothetical protein
LSWMTANAAVSITLMSSKMCGHVFFGVIVMRNTGSIAE